MGLKGGSYNGGRIFLNCIGYNPLMLYCLDEIVHNVDFEVYVRVGLDMAKLAIIFCQSACGFG